MIMTSKPILVVENPILVHYVLFGVFIGYCPVGLNCRWAQSHVTEDLKLVYKKEQIPIEEVGGDGGV